MCKEEECERAVYVRGWCRRHYYLWYTYGDPQNVPTRALPPYERLMRHVVEDGECWILDLVPSDSGYVNISLGRKDERTTAHRFVYEHCNGPIPEGLQVRHKCDRRNCIQPKHLELGTHQDNMDDRSERQRGVKGERSGMAKLTEMDVLAIRAAYTAGNTITNLARQYGRGESTIHSVIQRRTWRHI